MGSRADFYTEINGDQDSWLGSIAWDGYPGGVFGQAFDALFIRDIPLHRPEAKQERWESQVKNFLTRRDDGTFPKQGWPWPWDDSDTSDYSYALHDGRVVASSFGSPWWYVDETAVNGGAPCDESAPEDNDDHYGFSNGDPRSDRDGLGWPKHPDMSALKNVTRGTRSGVMVIGPNGPIPAEEIDAAEAAPVHPWIQDQAPADLTELQGLVAPWSAYNWPDHEEIDSAGSLCEEAGEVMRTILKRRSGLRGTADEWRGKAIEEAGDAIISALCLSVDLDFDLWGAVVDRWMMHTRHMDRNADPLAQGLTSD